jgi:hypothetical protein
LYYKHSHSTNGENQNQTRKTTQPNFEKPWKNVSWMTHKMGQSLLMLPEMDVPIMDAPSCK